MTPSPPPIVIMPGPAEEDDFLSGSDATLTYVIASVQRTGSSLLARGLWESGVAGAPNEYFNPLQRRLFDPRWGRLSNKAFVQRLRRHRTSDNGLFGIKIHFSHMRRLGIDLGGLLGPARYIATTRVDEVAQAASLEIARQTGMWTSEFPGNGRDPVYRSAAIKRRLAEIRRSEIGWERFFARNGIEPLRLTYEAIAENYEQSQRTALEFLGVDGADVPVGPPSLRPVANETASEWYERFRGETDEIGDERSVMRDR